MDALLGLHISRFPRFMAQTCNNFTRFVTSGSRTSSSYFKVFRAVKSNGHSCSINHELRSEALPLTISKVWSLGRVWGVEEMIDDGGASSSSKSFPRSESGDSYCTQTRWSWTVLTLTPGSWPKNLENWAKFAKLTTSVKAILVKFGSSSTGHTVDAITEPDQRDMFDTEWFHRGKSNAFKKVLMTWWWEVIGEIPNMPDEVGILFNGFNKRGERVITFGPGRLFEFDRTKNEKSSDWDCMYKFRRYYGYHG